MAKIIASQNTVLLIHTDFSASLYFSNNDKLQHQYDLSTLTDLSLNASSILDVLIPGQWVVNHLVTLPKSSQKNLLTTLPFAIEEMCVDSIDQLYIALGKQHTDDRWQVSVIDKARWENLYCNLSLFAKQIHRIIPDYFSLPLQAHSISLYLYPRGVWFRIAENEGFSMELSQVSAFLPEQENVVIYYDPQCENQLLQLPKLAKTQIVPAMQLPSTTNTIAQSPINLLQQGYPSRIKKNVLNRHWKYCVGIFIAWLFVFFSTHFLFISHLEKQTLQLQKHILSLSKPFSHRDEYSTQIRSILSTQLLHEKKFVTQYPFLYFLASVSNCLKQNSFLQLNTIDFNHRVLKIELTASTTAQIDALINQLKKQGLQIIQNRVHVNHQQVQAKIEVTNHV